MLSVQNAISILALFLATAVPTTAQSNAQHQWILPEEGMIADSGASSPILRRGETSGRVSGLSPAQLGQPEGKRAAATFPTFKSTIAVGRSRYPFTMVGSSPFLKGAKPVVVSVPIIPVVLQFSDGTVLDPTDAGSGCAGDTSALDLTLASPVFQDLDYGDGVGRQFVEQVRREEFWAYTAPGRLNPNYSVRIVPTVLPTLAITLPSDFGVTEAARCGRTGRVWGLFLESIIRNAVLPQLPKLGVNARSFPVLLLLNAVVDFPGGTFYGYHSRVAVGGQTYGVSLFDTSESLLPDISVLSHEIAEWYDDPYVNNSTPAWGHLGQVEGCQNTLEGGDPLTGTFWPPIKMPNGFVYHVQETAFFSWFFRQVPSLGFGGWYSSFGTFLSPAEPCS